MITSICLLRGINVGGHKSVRLEALRKVFEGMGFKDVRTYIQSGNVVFLSANECDEELVRKIEARLLKEFGFPIPVIVRTAAELQASEKL